MNPYLVVRSTHVTAMVLTVILILAVEPLVLTAVRVRSIAQVEWLYHLTQRLAQLSQLTALVGLLAGIAMVVMAEWSPFAPWLVATYGLLALMNVVGRVGRDWRRRLEGALQLDGGGALADVRSILGDRRALLARLAVIAIFFTIMMLMREKPSFDF